MSTGSLLPGLGSSLNITRQVDLNGLRNTCGASTMIALVLQLAIACGGEFSESVLNFDPPKSIENCRRCGSRGSTPMRVAITLSCVANFISASSRVQYMV